MPPRVGHLRRLATPHSVLATTASGRNLARAFGLILTWILGAAFASTGPVASGPTATPAATTPAKPSTTPTLAPGSAPTPATPSPESVPGATGTDQGQPPATAAEAPVVFDIWAFRIDGNTVLGDKEQERAVYPFAGPGKTLEDVQKARQALEKAYHDAGYTTVLVDIPEQSVDEGLVVLSVTEGRVGRLRVTGSQYHSIEKIKEQVPALAEGKVPHMPTAQQQLAKVAGESQDRSVTPVLRAGNSPGKLDVDLQVKDELPLHGSLEMNSRNAAYTTYTRLLASIRYDNLWQKQHSASLQYQVSPQNYEEVQVWSGTYALPTSFYDTRLAFYGVGINSNTDIAAVGATSVIGTGQIFGARAITPFASGGGLYHTATFGLDYKNFGQSVVLGSDTQSSPIQYLPFVLGYGLMHRGEGRITSADLRLNFSIRGFGNDQQQFSDRRYGAQSNYLYLVGDIKHQEILPYDIMLAARFTGQITDMPLISNEQFAAGGVGSVRGYHIAEALGDDGVNGSLEVLTPMLVTSDYIDELRLLAFADAARLWILQALPDTPTGYSLAGAGAGIRLRALHHVVSEMDWSYPFLSVGTVRSGEQRIDFRVAYEF